MLNKVLICLVMLALVIGCANQQKDTAEEQAEQAQETEATEQAQEAEVSPVVQEISLTVNGMT